MRHSTQPRGEAGTDNKAQLYKGKNVAPDYFASPIIQSTTLMNALLSLIEALIDKNKYIVPSRIYMTGLSRGGQGVWNSALQRPDLFAALVPIAGSGSPGLQRLIELPIWEFHGGKDTITNVGYTREMIDALIRARGTTKEIRYTEILGGGHTDSWLTAFKDEQLYRWLISHHRR